MSSDRDLQEKMDPEVQAFMERYRGLTADDLKRVFAEAVNATREGILSASAAFAVLEERGEKPSGDPALFSLFRKVASGRWSPDAIIRFGTERYVMKKVLAMPRPQQDAILQKPDDEVRQEIKRQAEAQKEKQPPERPEPKTVRHITTNYAYDELKRQYDLLKVEAEQLRARAAAQDNTIAAQGRTIATLQAQLDAVTAKRGKRRARPVGV